MQAFRKLADKSKPSYDEKTGQQKQWPCLGMIFIDPDTRVPLDEPQARLSLSEKVVAGFVDEGLMTLVNERVVTAPGGPPSNPNKKTHTFRQCDEIIVHVLDKQGQKVDARYKVVRNPGKYPCTEAEYLANVPEKHRPKTKILATEVVYHTYECELVSVTPAKVLVA